MPKDIIPLVVNDFGSYNVNTSEDITIMYHNVSPIKTGSKEYSLSVRPSLGTVTTTASIDDNSRGRGVADFKGYDLMLVNDDTWYYSGGSTEIHTATPFDKEAIAKFTLYSQAGSDRLVLVNAGDVSTAGTADGSMWFMTDTTTAPTEITDVHAPGYNGNSLIRGGVSLDGYFFAADILGNIHNCQLDNLPSWLSADFIVAEREADTGVYLAKHRDHVVYIGTRSIEFFYNVANVSGSPLTRRNDIYYSTGCFHPNTVLELGDIIYFIGKDATGNSGLWVLDNFQLQKISTNNVIVDNIIKGLEYAEPDITGATTFQQNCYLAAFNSEKNGQFLVLTTPADGSWALHIETGIWAKWYLGGTPANNGGITDWTSPKIFPLTASLNRAGASTTEPNRYLLLNGLVSSEFVLTGSTQWAGTGTKDFTSEVGAGSVWNLTIGNSGTKLYVLDSDVTTTIYQYTLSTAYDITTATYDSKSFNIGAGERDITFNTDGTSIFHLKGGASTLKKRTLSTAWDISTIGGVDAQSFGIGTNPTGGFWGREGKSFFHGGTDGVSRVYRLDTPTAYDVANLTGVDNFILSGAIGVAFDSTGIKLYVANDSTNKIEFYTCGTAWTPSTAVATGETIDVAAPPRGLHFENNIFYTGAAAAIGYMYGDLEFAPIEFGGQLIGVDNPDYTAYSRPWDKDTNERKKIKNLRVLHYADGRTSVSPSNLKIDWIDLDTTTTNGVVPAAFTNDKTIDIAGHRARIYRGGITRQRIYKMTFDGTKSQIIKGLELDYEPLRG